MNSFFPRSKNVIVDGMGLYQKFLPSGRGSLDASAQLAARVSETASHGLTKHLAKLCVAALDEVAALPPVLSPTLADPVYQWLARMPGFGLGDQVMTAELEQLLAAKRARQLL
jgi:hypothetical protein